MNQKGKGCDGSHDANMNDDVVKNSKKQCSECDDAPANDTAVAEETPEENGSEACGEVSDLETLKNLLQEKEDEVAKEKKEYLFLMAEFDNFRKRTLRERTDLIKSASEKALKGLLPIIDDFERGLDAIKDTSDAEAVKEGMKLIYNKLIKYLADNGVKEMPSTGSPFDPDLHEAVAMVPAASDDEKGVVKDTVSKGYTINDKVLRHAKVVVAQ
ncbi:MAG: nucleotide exchange factor GrpE [Muribaculaceae bacterium]|nr:nucleotide exchange factor GrpE [Muribaculaceae bacterium]